MLEKIIKNLETGAYRIEYREHCDCRFNWRLENDELVCDTDGVSWIDCWIDNVLIMDDLAGQRDDELSVGSDGVIAIYDAYMGLTVFLIRSSQDVLQKIVNAIQNSDAYQKLADGIDSPDANNDLHDKRKQAALVDWLKEISEKGECKDD